MSDSEDQLERFKKFSRELGCDESEERFNESLKRIAKARPKRNKKSDSPKQDPSQ